MIPVLTGENVSVRFGEKTVVDHVSFRLEEGQWLMLIGPNGAGKSTLIEALAGGVPYSGAFRWQGQDLRSFSGRELARKIGILGQRRSVLYAYTVQEIVELGRYAHRQSLFGGGDPDGAGSVGRALEITGLTDLRHQNVMTLSGGEIQRVFLAQVIAQNPQVLILDEPANHLDLKYQQHIFSLIGEWLEEPGRAVLSVVHDLSLARRWGTHALLMDRGKCVSRGLTEEVLTPDHLQSVYAMDVYAWMREMLAQWE